MEKGWLDSFTYPSTTLPEERADGYLKPAAGVLRETYGRWVNAASVPEADAPH